MARAENQQFIHSRVEMLTVLGPFARIRISKSILVCTGLLVLVLGQALGVIYIKQNKRLLYAELQRLYAVRDKLQIQWSQLLLEQSTWAAAGRVERVAREKLDMMLPDKVHVIIPS